MRFKIPKPFDLRKIKFNLFPSAGADETAKNDDTVQTSSKGNERVIRDMGNAPYVFDIEKEIDKNNNLRTALWTGKHLQLVLMNIPVGGETGMEIHDDTDQLFKIEDGEGEISMGRVENNISYVKPIDSDSMVMIPAGTYHNIKNTGREPLKLYTVYAPPHHPFGTEEK